jgi:ribosome maturation factor RimP
LLFEVGSKDPLFCCLELGRVMDLIDKITEIVERQLHIFGAELIEITLKGKPGRYRLTVIADTMDGITINQCTQISRHLLELPELEEVLGENFVLEVSSPGVDRPLTTEKEFRLKIGRELEVSFLEGEEEKTVRGELVDANADGILLNVSGEMIRIVYGQLKKAVQALPW